MRYLKRPLAKNSFLQPTSCFSSWSGCPRANSIRTPSSTPTPNRQHHLEKSSVTLAAELGHTNCTAEPKNSIAQLGSLSVRRGTEIRTVSADVLQNYAPECISKEGLIWATACRWMRRGGRDAASLQRQDGTAVLPPDGQSPQRREDMMWVLAEVSLVGSRRGLCDYCFCLGVRFQALGPNHHAQLALLMSPRPKWLRSLKTDKTWEAFTQAQDGAQATGDHKSAQIQSALSVACVGGRVAAALKASCRSAGVRVANGKGFLPACDNHLDQFYRGIRGHVSCGRERYALRHRIFRFGVARAWWWRALSVERVCLACGGGLR